MKAPIETIHLFRSLDEKLISLLRSLTPEEWKKQTVAPLWNVKDVAAHLLDGNFRAISMVGDGYFGDPPEKIESYQDLVDYLNKLNADWVKAMKRVSPPVIIDLLENTGPHYEACMASLDPFAPAMFAVSWAGDEESPNWFHIAREFTEKWHHQQQIRDAVGKQGIMDREFFFPVMDTFMRALPHTYCNTDANEGATVRVQISTDAWMIRKTVAAWELAAPVEQPSVTITMEPDTAWKLFTKALPRTEALSRSTIKGNELLAGPLFSMLSVMA